MPIEDLTFLESGEFTAVDGLVKSKAHEINSISRFSFANTDALKAYVQSMPTRVRPDKFRRRNASQIIREGYISEMSRGHGGCTDRALVFISLARALGVPTRYLETLGLDYINLPEIKIHGHVIVEVGYGHPLLWNGFDPSKGHVQIKEGHYFISGREYVVAGAGLDFGAVYPRTRTGFESNPIALKDVESIKQLGEKAKLLLKNAN